MKVVLAKLLMIILRSFSIKNTFNSSIMLVGHRDTQRSDIQHNNTQHYLSYKPHSALRYVDNHNRVILNVILLSAEFFVYCYVKCRNVECRFS